MSPSARALVRVRSTVMVSTMSAMMRNSSPRRMARPICRRRPSYACTAPMRRHDAAAVTKAANEPPTRIVTPPISNPCTTSSITSSNVIVSTARQWHETGSTGLGPRHVLQIHPRTHVSIPAGWSMSRARERRSGLRGCSGTVSLHGHGGRIVREPTSWRTRWTAGDQPRRQGGACRPSSGQRPRRSLRGKRPREPVPSWILHDCLLHGNLGGVVRRSGRLCLNLGRRRGGQASYPGQ